MLDSLVVSAIKILDLGRTEVFELVSAVGLSAGKSTEGDD